jgi:hypothetical protein
MNKTSKCCKASVTKQYAGNYFCNHCISICETKHNVKIAHILFTLLIGLISISCYAPKDGAKKHIKKAFIDTCKDKDIQLIDSCIYYELQANNCYFPEVAMKQLHQECGKNINSDLAIHNKNLFGLKCSCKYSKGIRNHHSVYSSYKDCVKCYVNFTNRYWEKYCKNYATDSLYLKKLIKI